MSDAGPAQNCAHFLPEKIKKKTKIKTEFALPCSWPVCTTRSSAATELENYNFPDSPALEQWKRRMRRRSGTSLGLISLEGSQTGYYQHLKHIK